MLANPPSPAGAQAVGSEFQVNTYTSGTQETGFYPGRVIAADEGGSFVVVWSGRGRRDSYGIFGQRYDSAGGRRGHEFRVNTTTAGLQDSPAVASDPNGNFVVVWEGPDGSSSGIFGKRYDSGGGALGAEFRVNSFTASSQEKPAAASGPDGSFVVAWESYHTGDFGEIFARRYDSAGNALGAEFRVNSYTTGFQYRPAVASDAGGNFVVVWGSFPYNYTYGRFGVFGQRYDSTGNPLGNEFTVSSFGSPPSISSDAGGNFVVVWNDHGAYGGEEIYGRRFDSDGAPLGSQFHVNTYTTDYQQHAQVASDQDGNFVVVWQSFGQDGQYDGVFGRRYDSTGAAQGRDFRINSHTTGAQGDPSIAATGTSEFVAVWTSENGQDGNDEGVFGRRIVVSSVAGGLERGEGLGGPAGRGDHQHGAVDQEPERRDDEVSPQGTTRQRPLPNTRQRRERRP